MKKKLLATALLMSASLGAQADQSPYNFFETKFVAGETTNTSPAVDSTGIHFHGQQLVAKQVFLGAALEFDNAEVSFGNIDRELDTSTIELFLGGHLDLGDAVSIIGQVGYAHVEFERSDSNGVTTVIAETDERALTADLSIRLKPTQSVYFDIVTGRAELQDTDDTLKTYVGAKLTAAMTPEFAFNLLYAEFDESDNNSATLESDQFGVGFTYFYR